MFDPFDDYEKRLSHLECPFKWLKEANLDPRVVERKIATLDEDCKIEPHMSQPIHALQCYFLTLDSKRRNLKQAMECINKGLSIDLNEHALSCGSEFVLKANKLYILYLRRQEDNQLLGELEGELRNIDQNVSLKSSIFGTKGLALSRMGLDYYKQGIIAFDTAISIDEKNPHWHYGKAMLLGRIRRDDKGIREIPCDNELLHWEKALAFSKGEIIPVYQAWYAFTTAEKYKNSPQTSTNDKSKASDLCKEALKHEKEIRDQEASNHEVYRLCAKTFQVLEMFKDKIDCLELGMKNCKEKQSLQHALGTHYHRNKLDIDLDKAEQYLSECIKTFNMGNIYAELELIDVKIKKSERDGMSYTPEDDYCDLESKYSDPKSKVEIHKAIGKYFIGVKETGKAIREFIKAIDIEKNEKFQKLSDLSGEIENKMKKHVETDTSNSMNIAYLAYFYQHINPKSDENLKKAVTWYTEALKNVDKIDSPVANAIKHSLANVFMQLKAFCKAKALLCELAKENPIPTKVKDDLVKCLYEIGERGDLEQCISFGCLDAVSALVELEKESNPFVYTTAWYEKWANYIHVVERENSFFLKDVSSPKAMRERIKDEIRDLLGAKVMGPMKQLRAARLEMSVIVQTNKPHDEKLTNIGDVLKECRSVLDRAYRKLGVAIFNLNASFKRDIYFPVFQVGKNHTVDDVKGGLLSKIENASGNFGGYTYFKYAEIDKLRLIDILAKENYVHYDDVLRPLWEIVTILKHETSFSELLDDGEIEEDKYEIDTWQNDNMNMLDLAHKSAEFTERIVLEFEKYLDRSSSMKTMQINRGLSSSHLPVDPIFLMGEWCASVKYVDYKERYTS